MFEDSLLVGSQLSEMLPFGRVSIIRNPYCLDRVPLIHFKIRN